MFKPIVSGLQKYLKQYNVTLTSELDLDEETLLNLAAAKVTEELLAASAPSPSKKNGESRKRAKKEESPQEPQTLA